MSYDARGNTLTDGFNLYPYDILNRQTGVTNSEGTAEYIYDARGRRVAKIVAGQTTHYLYDTRYRVLEERDENEALLATYTYGQGMDEPLTMERGNSLYFYHRDALGSVTEISDSDGTIVERYEYDVYGAATIFDGNDTPLSVSAIGNPYHFTTRRYDPESGNYYYRARIYSPDLGRFLSMDPLGFDAGDYNLYRYAFNNPTTLTDPTGEFAFVPWLAKAGVEAAVDALMQVVMGYYFDPNITTLNQAINQIDYRQVGVAFVTGLLPGGNLAQAAAGALGDVFLHWLDAQNKCAAYPLEQLIEDFGQSFATQLIGAYAGDAVAKYGLPAIAKGLQKLGVDATTIKKVLKRVDEPDGPSSTNRQPRRPTPDFCSFSADTLVTTRDGRKPISTLQPWEEVWAYNEETGEFGWYPVTAVWMHVDQTILYLTLDGEIIETTPEHLFLTPEGDWVAAGALQVGDRVQTAAGYGLVEAVVFVTGSQAMYNLTVDQAHTYLVGVGRWVVYNECAVTGGPYRGGRKL